jgi:DNA-binding IclR family transcriptional regulator
LIGRSAGCVHRVQSAQQLRISFEPGQPLPLERGASARLLLASLAPHVRKEYLTPLAERDPETAALLEKKILMAGQQGFATSEEEIHKGVWAASAQVMQGKRVLAALTVPSPLVRADVEQRTQLLNRVRSAAREISEGLRLARR